MSSQKDLIDWIFIEIWADIGLNPPYLLQLIHRKDEKYEILDPQQNNKKLYETQTYEASAYWLSEDEYQLLSKRVANEFLVDS